jgi:hypothetical protein
MIMKHEANGEELGECPRRRKLPVIGTIKAEDVNPVLLSLMRSGQAGVFGRVESEDEEPVADTMEIAIMDVIQARRYFAQEFVEWVESLHLPIKKEHHIIGHVVGQLYRLEQELLARLGLVTD